MSNFNSPKNKKKFIKIAQKGEAHVQCVNNHNTKFENKGMKTARVQHPSKTEKVLLNVH